MYARAAVHWLRTLTPGPQESEFTNAFIREGGVQSIVRVIEEANGNTLAYALTALLNLTEHDHGWSSLDVHFISRVCLLFGVYVCVCVRAYSRLSCSSSRFW